MAYLEVKVLLKMIETADDAALSEIVQAVLRRYAELFSEEVVFLSMPKQDIQERRRILELALRLTGE